MTSANDILTVGEYLDRLNSVLKNQSAKIVGEVTEVKTGPSGHVYFSLKDEKVAALVPCVIWGSKYRAYGVELHEGLKIYASGLPNIYAPYGKFTFVADVLELAGEGALKAAYEKLRKKLESEGLFSPDRKRAIPQFPHRIGVITSRSGAVIHDFSVNLGKHGFQIIFVDSKVEGQEATDDLLSAVKFLATKSVDVLVVMRGGGSLESFQAFNNESLVRALSDFPAPVITGIGHEKDAPLSSLVSDVNVSTPTAVAHILSKGFDEAVSKIGIYESKLLAGFDFGAKKIGFKLAEVETKIEKKFSAIFEEWKIAESRLSAASTNLELALSRSADFLSNFSKNIFREFEVASLKVAEKINQSQSILDQASPMRQLSRGYSIVRVGSKVIKSVQDVQPGAKLDVTVADGNIETIVK